MTGGGHEAEVMSRVPLVWGGATNTWPARGLIAQHGLQVGESDLNAPGSFGCSTRFYEKGVNK